MAHSASARKRHRQNLRNRERNRAVKSALKASVRKVLTAVSEGDTAAAQEHLRVVAKRVDRAAAGRTIHKNRAARIKSRLAARIRKADGSSAATRPAAAVRS